MRYWLIFFLMILLVACDTNNNDIAINDYECSPDNPCIDGQKCYYSQICSMTPNGVECGEASGDFKCHVSCSTDSDCPSSSPKCESVTIFSGDAGDVEKMCFS